MDDTPVTDHQIEYACTGGELVLDVDWPVASSAELTVRRVRGGVTTTLTEGPDYEVSGIGNARGCQVGLAAAALAGDVYLITGATEIVVQGSPATYFLARWRGAWVVETRYAIGDAVRSGGSSYVSLANHRATAATEPGVGDNWPDVWDLEAQRGDPGPANSIEIGTVSTGDPGSSVEVSLTGSAPDQTLNITIPRGDDGAPNSLEIGSVTTGAAGSSADATITGDAPSQTLSLTIPRGDQGIPGVQGVTGAQGAAVIGTSTTSMTPASSGSFTLTTQTGLAVAVGDPIVVQENGGTRQISGTVTAYSGTSLTFTATASAGSGAGANWLLFAPSSGVASINGLKGALNLIPAGAAPSYSYAGGQGDRTAIITVTASSGLLYPENVALANNLVDGATGVNTNDCTAFVGTSAAGAWIKFSWPPAASKVITEATWKQTSTHSHGVWQWQGSNDDSAWTDIGATFTLGGATSQVQTTLATNIAGYRYYRLLGVSGTTSGNPFVQEIEFKISGTLIDAVGTVPPGGAANALLSKTTATDFDFAWLAPSAYVTSAEAIRRLPSSVVSFWPCDEGKGTVLRDIVGTKTFDWTSVGYGGTVGWTTEGRLRTQSGYIKTPSQSTQALILVFRAPEAASNYFCSTPDINGYLAGNAVSTPSGATLRSLDGWGIREISRRDNGQLAQDWFAGGWNMVSMAQTAASTGTSCIGSYNNSTGNATASLEIEGILVCSAAPSDADLRQILNVVRQMKRARGVYLTPWDCPRNAHLVTLLGESTAAGTAALTSIADRAANNEAVLIQARNSGSQSTTGLATRKLVYTASYANAAAPDVAGTDFGAERGLMLARIERPNDGRPLHICKLGQGSTYLVPPGTYTNAAGGSTTVAASVCRYPTASDATGLMTGGLFWMLQWRNTLRMERQARNAGVGYTTVTDLWCEGLNDAYLGTGAVTSAATYQGYLQEMRDKRKVALGISNLKQILLKPHQPSGGLGGGDPDYPNDSTGTNRLTANGYIRTACASFQAANSADVQTLDGDTFGVDAPGDYTHPSASGYEAMGRALEALLSYATEVVPLA